MTAYFFQPHPSLQHLVHNIMVSGSTVPKGENLPVTPFPPLAQHSLYFYIHDRVGTQFFGERDFKPSPKSMIIGPHLLRVNIKLGYDNLVVRVGFQPGGLYRLVKFPMHEILDCVCDGQDVFGNEINEVHEKLNEATGAVALKNIVETFLMKQAVQQNTPFITSIKHLIHYNGNVPIKTLAEQSGLSTRQFERKCNEYLGLAPKQFARITRFSKAFRLKGHQPKANWTSIAYQCGYFDQMHFIRDFKEFAGVTPTYIEQELACTPFRLQTDISF